MKSTFSPIEIPPALLNNPEQLRDFTVQLGKQFNAVLAVNEKLTHELQWLKRQIFGQKSERFIPNEAQLGLGLDVPENQPPATKERVQYDRTKPAKKQAGHGRGTMPTNLPIEDIVIEPQEDVTGLEQIGQEESWELEYEPGRLKVVRYLRPKYVRKGEGSDDILIGVLPPRPIEKGNSGPGLMARVVTDKFLYHLPLDRQRKRFQVEDGVEIAESTLCDIVRRTAFWIEPIYRVFVEKIRSASYLQADETPIPVLVKEKKGKTHQGYFWVYYDPLGDLVVFDYRKGRSRDGPSEMLQGFKGVLQVDGYAGYNEILSKSDIRWASCMAHVRRKFEQAKDSDPERAEHALKTIGTWFTVEAEAKEAEAGFDQRLALRQQRTVPSMQDFHSWMKQEHTLVLPKSPMGGAISYALNQWPGFEPFMTDGRIELSNNFVENAIRPVTLGRKNYLFKGSHNAAGRAAMIYSLFATATKHKIDSFAYLKDLLKRLPAAKNTEIENFIPQNWKTDEENQASAV